MSLASACTSDSDSRGAGSCVAEAARVRVLVHVVPEGVQLVGLNEPGYAGRQTAYGKADRLSGCGAYASRGDYIGYIASLCDCLIASI